MTRPTTLAALFVLLAVPATATDEECEIEGLGGASPYNLVTLDDFTGTNSEILGKAAVGGDLDVVNYGIGTSFTAAIGTVLSVGDTATMTNVQVRGGDAEVGGACSLTSTTIKHGTISCNDSAAFDATSLTAEMEALSTHLAGLTPTHTTTYHSWGGIELKGSGDVVVFDVDLDLAKAAFGTGTTRVVELKIDVAKGTTVIVNVTGDTSVFLKSMGFMLVDTGPDDPVEPETVLMNFPDATGLEISGIGIKGSVLAPYAHVDFDAGHIEGTLVCYSMEGTGELQVALFEGDICTPPEEEECPDDGLGVAGGYNVFTFGKFHGWNSDIEGKTAIGGFARFTSYGIASGESGGDVVLSIVGDAVIESSQIYGGDAEVGGTCTTSSLGTPDGTLTCTLGSSVFDPSDYATEIGDLSDYLADLPDSGTVTVYDWGVVDLTAGSDDLAVFNLDLTAISADMAWSSRIYTLNIKAGATQTVLVNVTGDTTVMMDSMGFGLSGGVGYGDIVFHYPDATSLKVNAVTVPGALLIPNGTLEFYNGNIEGTVVADKIKGTGEFHFTGFEGSFCPPEGE